MTRAADRYLAGLLVLLLLAAAVASAFGLRVVDEDLRYSGEMFDGLGVLLGLTALALVALPAGLGVVALTRLLRGRATAHRWAMAAGVVGFLAVIPFGVMFHGLFVLLVLPALLVVAAAATDADPRTQ